MYHYDNDPDSPNLFNHSYRPGEEPNPQDRDILEAVRQHRQRNPLVRVLNTLNGNLTLDGRLKDGEHPDAWQLDEDGKPHHVGM